MAESLEDRLKAAIERAKGDDKQLLADALAFVQSEVHFKFDGWRAFVRQVEDAAAKNPDATVLASVGNVVILGLRG